MTHLATKPTKPSRPVNAKQLNRRIVAFHEAGHAVCAVWGGFALEFVSIEGTNATRLSGLCQHAHDPDQPFRPKLLRRIASGLPVQVNRERAGHRWCERYAVVSAAGYLGETRSGCCPPSLLDSGYDRQLFLSILDRWGRYRPGDAGFARYAQRILDCAERVVNRYGAAVDTLAQVLISRKRIDGDRARAIIKATTGLKA
jgi:hypothetical protein